jgi:hypothetical protein
MVSHAAAAENWEGKTETLLEVVGGLVVASVGLGGTLALDHIATACFRSSTATKSSCYEIAWFGFTELISAKTSARDWICGWNQGHIGINPRLTLGS